MIEVKGRLIQPYGENQRFKNKKGLLKVLVGMSIKFEKTLLQATDTQIYQGQGMKLIFRESRVKEGAWL
ncbi:hypothetical protein [Brevibacillus formosus]|uniref:hypothetical protein n=1 Tax=Brevibacillus formosus TaxID=54913 RepID=UPI003F1C6B57